MVRLNAVLSTGNASSRAGKFLWKTQSADEVSVRSRSGGLFVVRYRTGW